MTTAVSTPTEQKPIHTALHHVLDVVRALGHNVQKPYNPGGERAFWEMPDGSSMEAITFTECLDTRDPGDLYGGMWTAVAIQPVGANLAGFWTRVVMPWGEFRHPAGQNPNDTGIQYLFSQDRHGETEPMFNSPEEGAAAWITAYERCEAAEKQQ